MLAHEDCVITTDDAQTAWRNAIDYVAPPECALGRLMPEIRQIPGTHGTYAEYWFRGPVEHRWAVMIGQGNGNGENHSVEIHFCEPGPLDVVN